MVVVRRKARRVIAAAGARGCRAAVWQAGGFRPVIGGDRFQQAGVDVASYLKTRKTINQNRVG